MENTNDSLTVVAAQEGPSVSVVGDTYRTNICSEQTNDAYALIDMLIPEFQGMPSCTLRMYLTPI